MSNLLLGAMFTKLRKLSNNVGITTPNIVNSNSNETNSTSGHGEHKEHEPTQNNSESNSENKYNNEDNNTRRFDELYTELADLVESSQTVFEKRQPIPNIDYLTKNKYYPLTYFGNFPSTQSDKNKLKQLTSSSTAVEQKLELLEIGNYNNWNRYVDILFDAVDALNNKFTHLLITDLYEYMVSNDLIDNGTTLKEVLDLDMFFLPLKDYIIVNNGNFALSKINIMTDRPMCIVYHYTLYNNLTIIKNYNKTSVNTNIDVYEPQYNDLNTQQNNLPPLPTQINIPTAERGIYENLAPFLDSRYKSYSFINNNISETIISKPFNNNLEIISNILMTLGLFIGGLSPIFFDTVYYLTQFRHKTKNINIIDSLMRNISGWYLDKIIIDNESNNKKNSKWELARCDATRHEFTYKISAHNLTTNSNLTVNNCIPNIIFQTINAYEIDTSYFYGEFFPICFVIMKQSYYKTNFFDIDINIINDLKNKLQNLLQQKDVYYKKLHEIDLLKFDGTKKYCLDDIALFDNPTTIFNRIFNETHTDTKKYLTYIFEIVFNLKMLHRFQKLYMDFITKKIKIIDITKNKDYNKSNVDSGVVYENALHIVEDIIVDIGSKYNEIATIILNNIKIINPYAKKIYDNINNPNIIIPYKYPHGTYPYLYVLNLNLLGFDNLAKFMSFITKKKYFMLNANYKIFIKYLYNEYNESREISVLGSNKIEKMKGLIDKLIKNEDRSFYFIMNGHSVNDLKEQFKYIKYIINESNKEKADVSDPGLTNLGVQQSLSLRKRIHKNPVDFIKDLTQIKVVFTSFLQRTIQTAMIAYSGTNVIIIPIPYIRDLDVGAKNRVNTKNLPNLQRMANKLGVKFEPYFYTKHLRHNAGIVASMSGKRYALKLKNAFLRILLELFENVMCNYPLSYSKSLLRGKFVFFTHSRYADKALKLNTPMQLASITKFQYNLSSITKCSIIHYRSICAPNNSITYMNTAEQRIKTSNHYSYYNDYIVQSKNSINNADKRWIKLPRNIFMMDTTNITSDNIIESIKYLKNYFGSKIQRKNETIEEKIKDFANVMINGLDKFIESY
jgi:hypothetical protein